MKKIFEVNNDNGTITFSAVINNAYKQTKEENGESIKKNTINVTPDDVAVFDAITAYNESGKKFTPSWLKNREHMMLRSVYDIPFEIDGERYTFDEFCERGKIRGAVATVKIVQKDGAVYPVAVKIYEDGAEFNPFDGM